MTFRNIIFLMSLSLTMACGAHSRPVPNDEVSTPMNADDTESLRQGSQPSQADAGPPEDVP